MKRFLLFAALCLFGSLPAKADVFHVQNGQYLVYGDLGEWGIQGNISFALNVSRDPGTYNPDTGPFFGYFVNVRVNDGMIQDCSFSQTMSMCGRNVHPPMRFDVTDPDGDGIGFLNVSGGVSTTNMTVSQFDMYVSLPDGFVVTGIPETSTWAMMLIGFAGLSVIERLRRRKLGAVRRLVDVALD